MNPCQRLREMWVSGGGGIWEWFSGTKAKENLNYRLWLLLLLLRGNNGKNGEQFHSFFFGGGEIRVSRMIKHFGPPAESPSPSDLWRNKVIVIFKLDYMGNKGERTERKWMREPSSDISGPIRLRLGGGFSACGNFFYSKIGNCFSLRSGEMESHAVRTYFQRLIILDFLSFPFFQDATRRRRRRIIQFKIYLASFCGGKTYVPKFGWIFDLVICRLATYRYDYFFYSVCVRFMIGFRKGKQSVVIMISPTLLVWSSLAGSLWQKRGGGVKLNLSILRTECPQALLQTSLLTFTNTTAQISAI